MMWLEEAAKIPGSSPGGPTTCLCVGHVYKKVYYVLIFAIRCRKVKTMRKTYGEHRPDEEDEGPSDDEADFTCDTCGESYHKPLLATVFSSGESEKYYACPRCMVKVGDVRTEKPQVKKEKPASAKVSERLGAEPAGGFSCAHFLGYLAKRSRDVPIPEECLTCNKMIECTIR